MTLAERFGNLSESDLDSLSELPCIFAYEAENSKTPSLKEPRFGFLKKVVKQERTLKISYEIKSTRTFLTAKQMFHDFEELGIESVYELMRSHWAVKDLDLSSALKGFGISLPPRHPVANISTHIFDVALTFPGEARLVVEPIALELASSLGRNEVFYDNHFTSQLARPNLDTLLQDIYRNRSRLVVVFLSGHYQEKEWCGVEFRAIREIIKSREDKVMFIRTDDGSVDGVFKTDGYIDARTHSSQKVASFIQERVEFLHAPTH